MSPRLAFVDLETTGATATADRITEVGIIEVDDDGVREWSSLVNPEQRIPRFIESLTGISNGMVADAPPFRRLAAEIAARLHGRVLVAHNARFDYGFLKNEFRRAGIDFRATVLCTVKLSRKLYPEHRRHNLDSLVERHRLQVTDRHRALGDARLIWQFWQKLQRELPPEEIQRAVAALTARPSLPPLLEPDRIDELPDGPGVYLFFGENDLPLYVGKGNHLRRRILSHFGADHRSTAEAALAQQVRRIEWIETAGELGALLKEAQLVKALQPIHNRRLRRTETLCSWRLTNRHGALAPVLVTARDPDFDDGSDLHGLFRSPQEATRALRAIADQHRLCHGVLGLENAAHGRPCFAHQVGKCRGACVGQETPASHDERLAAALRRLRIAAWPFPGPVGIREGDDVHVVDRWRYLGTARTESEIPALLEGHRPDFDRDIYQTLVKYLSEQTNLIPLPKA